MRIAIVSAFPPDPFGESHYAGQVFSAMARSFPEHEYKVFSFGGGERKVPITIPENIAVERELRPADPVWRHFSWLVLLIAIIRYRPSVVHLQGVHTKMWGGLLGEPMCLLLGALRIFGIPTVHTIHSTMMPSDINSIAGRRRLPAIGKRLFAGWFRMHTQLLTKLSSRLNVLCAGDGRQLISEFAAAWNLDADSLAMEVHACEYHPTPSAECERAKVELGFPGQRIALMLGFLRPDKNAHLLLRSADSVLSRIPDLHYVIAGEPRGPYGQSYAQSLYEQLAGVKHPHRIRLHPFYLSDTALDQYFTAADAVIVPYDKAPGASGPIHHALGRGKAVIAAAVGQNLGLSGTISLFPRGDHAALADSLLAMFLNEEMLVRAKARATRYAEAHTWELLAESYVRQYEELMGCACPREVRAP